MISSPFNAENYKLAMGAGGSITGVGYASPSKYLIEFSSAPEILRAGSLDESLSVTAPKLDWIAAKTGFAAATAEIPTRQIDTIERRYSGPIRNIPVGHTYSTMNIEFVESFHYDIRLFFAWWQENIFDKRNTYGVPYYKNVVVPQMKIKLFDNTGKVRREYVLYEVFPINIGSTNIAWNALNQSMTTNVEFAFHRWEVYDLEKRAKLIGGFVDGIEEVVGATKNGKKFPTGASFKFQNVVDTIRNVNNAVKFAKGTFKTAKAIVKSIRNLKNLRVRNLDDLANAAGSVGEVVRTTTGSVNNFGSGVQNIQKKFSTEQINKFFPK